MAPSGGSNPGLNEQERRMRQRSTRRHVASQRRLEQGLPWWGHALAILAGLFIGVIHYALYKHK